MAVKTTRYNQAGINSLVSDIRVAEIINNIRDRNVKIADLKAGVTEIEIIETEAILVTGEEVVLFHVKDNESDTIVVSKKDINSGAVTREMAYQDLANNYIKINK